MRYTGTIYNEYGKPLPGVKVLAVKVTEWFEDGSIAYNPATSVTAVTDAGGRYVIDIDSGYADVFILKGAGYQDVAIDPGNSYEYTESDRLKSGVPLVGVAIGLYLILSK